MISLRPYQKAAIKAADAMIKKGESPLIVHATGTGKTTTGASLVMEHAARGPVVWMAHRRELVEQAAARIESMSGREVGIEMADRRSSLAAWCTVATVQSLAARLRDYERGVASLLVVDEGHHAIAETYRTVRAHLGCPALGITATPTHSVEKLGFDGVAHTYDIRDAIRDGYLVRPMAVQVETEVDWTQLKVSGGDYTDASAEAAIVPALGEWCAAVARLIGSRPTVMFLPTVASAHAAAKTLRGLGVTAGSADGSTPLAERVALLDGYASGAVQVLVNCALWTEGWDAPHTACVAVGRPTKSHALYAQMVGRGLRPSLGKEDCLVIDLARSGSDCDLVLASLPGILGGPPEAEKAVAAAKPGETVDALATCERFEEEARAAKLIAVNEVDILSGKAKRGPKPVQFEDLGIKPGRDDRPPTDKQVAAIVRAGLRAPTTRGEASAAMAWLVPRWQAGLCSAKQARLLARYGLPTDVTMAAASEMIDAIAANGWRLPRRLA